MVFGPQGESAAAGFRVVRASVKAATESQRKGAHLRNIEGTHLAASPESGYLPERLPPERYPPERYPPERYPPERYPPERRE
jgi:hypothetical protein